MANDNLQVGPHAGEPPAQPQISVVNGKIQIGDRVFNVQVGGQSISDPVMLAKIEGLLRKNLQEGALSGAMGAVSPSATDALRIKIAAHGVSVHKGEASQTVATTDAFSTKFDRVEKIIQSNISFQAKVETAIANNRYTRADFAAAARSILQEQGVDYLSYAEQHLPFDAVREDPLSGNKVLAHLLQLRGNEGIFAGMRELAAGATEGKHKDTKKAKECEKDLRLFLVQGLTRNQKQTEVAGAGSYTQQMRMGHQSLAGLDAANPTAINPTNFSKPNCALTSAQDGGKTGKEIENHNTNLGSVVQTNRAGETQCVVTRSGKSHTLERLKEAVVDAACNQLMTDHPKGLVQRGDGTYEFQHAITSFMDFSWEKAIQSPGNERKFLKKMVGSLDDWPAEGYKITIKDKDGEEHIVVLKKPIIRQQLFSATTKGVNPLYDKVSDLGQTESDCVNFVSTGRCVNGYLQSRGERPEAVVAASRKLAALLSKGSDKNLLNEEGLIAFDQVSQLKMLENPAILKSKEYENYAKAVATHLLTKIANGQDHDHTALALYSIMFRKALPKGDAREGAQDVLANIDHFHSKPTPAEQLHPADLEIFSNIAYHNLNISSGKQCKSGKDRTAIGVALSVAQDIFNERHGAKFIPGQMAQEETLKFKSYFRKVLKEVCAETTLESQGYMGFKWDGGGGNPVPYKYLYNEEDVAYLKGHPEIDPDFKPGSPPDVVGLTQVDIDALGKQQLVGKLQQQERVYGTSSKKTRKEIQKAEAATAQNRTAAKGELEQFFRGLGVEKSVFNDSLQPALHIRELRIKHGDDKYRELGAKIATLSGEQGLTERMQLYALTTIKDLIDERAEIKAMVLPKREVSMDHIPAA